MHSACHDLSTGRGPPGCGTLERLGLVGKVKGAPKFLLQNARAGCASMLLCETPAEPASRGIGIAIHFSSKSFSLFGRACSSKNLEAKPHCV